MALRGRWTELTTGTLGRQVAVMLGVALLAGLVSTAVFSWVFTGEWLPWVPVSEANQLRGEAAEAAQAAAGTSEAEGARAALGIAAAEAAAAEAAAREAVRTGLLVVAGLGGVFGLVVAYRRQKNLEEHERPAAQAQSDREKTRLLTERFGRAAEQLGTEVPAVRLAGVYAMAALADEWAEQRQPCVDVLCGYMRLPPRGQEGEDQVRLTIVGVVRDHLQAGATVSWTDLDFDFRGGHFPPGTDFGGTTFSRPAQFAGATFRGPAWFAEATFSGDAWFAGATFSGDAWFGEATFTGGAQFDEATFNGTAWFPRVTFSRTAQFGRATFSRTAQFGRATFSGTAQFAGATFSKDAWFGEATFTGGAQFDEATFGGRAEFGQASIAHARFDKAVFRADAGFDGAKLGREIDLGRAASPPTSVWFPDPRQDVGGLVIAPVPPDPRAPDGPS